MLFFVNIPVFAQWLSARHRIEDLPKLENSRFECVYKHYDYDADNGIQNESDEILQLGRKYMTYLPYGQYKVDSILKSMDKKAVDEMSYTHYNNNILVENRWDGRDRMELDLRSRLLKEVRTGGARVNFSEQMPVLEWQQLPGEAEILGYKCKKAKCDFRGREWTVWYCPDIQVPYGPWKLNGLPGLILVANDKTNDHRFIAIGLRTKPTPMYTTREFENTKKVKREDYYRSFKEYCYSFCKGSWDAYYEDPVNNDKPAVKHLSFVPLELDF